VQFGAIWCNLVQFGAIWCNWVQLGATEIEYQGVANGFPAFAMLRRGALREIGLWRSELLEAGRIYPVAKVGKGWKLIAIQRVTNAA
jgi:hypothetical protein